MAVDLGQRGAGLGSAPLKHFIVKSLEVAELVGVRVMLVHAKDNAALDFYVHHGFEPSPIDELTLMLLIADVRASQT